jgi:anti-sigma28 factor (negative regulator of flagellin synthesis)
MVQNDCYITIHEDIKEELRKGNYKVNIAPSDLVDFGGQKSFDMTHQLFIRHKGEFILMFDKMALLSAVGCFSDVIFFLLAGRDLIFFSISGKLLSYLEGCFSCLMSGFPRSTLDKTSPSQKTDTKLVKGARNKDTHTELSKPQLQAQKMSKQSYITIHEDIKEELRKGNYKVNIAPSDLVDFGGQKSLFGRMFFLLDVWIST